MHPQARAPASRLTTPNRPAAAIESVGFLLIPGFSLLAYAAAVEPLRAANQLAGKTLYRWWHAALGNQPATASNGAAVLPDIEFGSDPGPLDAMLVCASGNPAKFNDNRTFAWLRKLARQGVVLGGISGGSFVLAKAGVLSGRRCTIHWEHMAALQESFPDIAVTRSLFVLDIDRITCSGGVAGLDMMVGLIARDHGSELATAVSEWLLHTQVREGVRPQRMDLRFRLGVRDERVLKVLGEMETHLETPLSRERLADLAGMSLRHLERAFRGSVGRGMHEHYLMLRLARSRQLLRETSLSMLEVALVTGFASPSQFARAFRREFGFPPSQSAERAAVVAGTAG